MRSVLSILLLSVLVAACSTGEEPAVSSPTAPGPDCPAELADPLGSWEDVGFRGAVLLVEGGREVCALGIGDAADDGTPITVDTVFAIGSVTKSVTAATVLSLVDDGALRLDTPVAEVLPELAGSTATVRDALLHEGGFGAAHATDEADLSIDGALELIADEEPLFAPGTDVSYSNTGYTVLAAIIERVDGRPFREAVVDRVLTMPGGDVLGGWWDGDPPASGPRAIGYRDGAAVGAGDPDAGPRWGLEGAGGMAMSVRELAAWTLALDDGELLGDEAVRLTTTPSDGRTETMGWVAAGPPDVPEAGLFSAGGGGTGHNVVVGWWPETDRALVMASNDDLLRAEALFERTLPGLIGDGRVPEAAVGRVDAGRVEELAGTYRTAEGAVLTISSSGGDAVVEADGRAISLLLPLPAEQADAAARHEAMVLDALDDASERQPLEAAYGEIERVEVVATVIEEAELRTHVAIGFADREVAAWFAFEENGELAAAEVPAPLSRLLLSPIDNAALDVVGSDGVPSGVVLRPTDDGLVIVAPDGTEIVARR